MREYSALAVGGYTLFMTYSQIILPFVMFLVSSLGACKTAPVTSAPSNDADAEIRAMMDQYFTDFNESRPEAISGVWHVPGWVASGNRNILLADEAAVVSFYKTILDTIEAEGYDHSDLLTADITSVNELCATIDFTFTRWNTDGEVMPPRVRPVSCVVLKIDGRWGINTLMFNTSSKIYD